MEVRKSADPAGKQVVEAKNFVLGNNTQMPDTVDVDKPFIFEGILMCACVTGRVEFRVNYKEFTMGAGQLLVILPSEIVCFGDRTEDLYCEMMYFPLDFLAEYPSPLNLDILIRISEDPLLSVSSETLRSILDTHALIVRHYGDEGNIYRNEIIKTLLLALLLQAGAGYVSARPERTVQAKSRQEEIAEKFFKLLFRHFKQERSVGFYAGKLCLTPKYLSAVLKTLSGRGALDWIDEIVIIEVKKQLRTSTLTVLQISEEFCFPNPSFFGRFFKQHTGMTPLQYRNGPQ